MIVVNAMAVERQRRISKQRDTVRGEGAAPYRFAWCALCRRWRRFRIRVLTVDDVLLFANRQSTRAVDVGLHSDEHHLPTATLLWRDALNFGLAAYFVA